VPARRRPPARGDGTDRSRVLFTFDGRGYEGIEGEPVAVSLLAAGRRTLSRSFRFHRPRGLMCSTGQCGWCECEVDGRPSVRTCTLPVREGMVVRGEHAWPSVERDLLRALDAGSRFVPPTFYHHRFLRPRRLRKAYLDVIRSFGGRGRLDADDRSGRAPRARAVRHDDPDVLVIGGGRGGLLSAVEAAATGARVVVLEAEAGDHADADPARLASAPDHPVDIRIGTVATGWYDGMLTAQDHAALWEFRPRAVVVATGTYELLPPVPGSDRPGVMGARLVRRVLDRHGVIPGRTVLLVGDGEELRGVGDELADAGVTVLGPVPTAALRAIGGRGPVAWARLADDAGVAPRVRVETVVIGDRTPNLDLVLAAGGRVAWSAGRLAPVAGPDGATSVAGLFVAGGASGDGAETPGGESLAREAGRSAARFASERGELGRATAIASLAGARPGDPLRSELGGRIGGDDGPGTANGHQHAGAVLCFCEDVRVWEIRREVASGYTDPELVKRRTGALTGPCQGKYCLASVTCAMRDGDRFTGADDLALVLPTGRPPLRPIRLADLVAGEAEAGSDVR
jgi:sarcosine oxidase, subunit alpha